MQVAAALWRQGWFANGKSMSLFLDDLFIGQVFSSGSHTVSADDMRLFAKQFDPQPFHIDEEAAKKTFFEGLAASGWYTAALTMRLNVESGLPLANGIIGASSEIAWPTPLRPGDTVHVESEVLDIRPSRSRPDRGIVTIVSKTLNQRGEPVQILTAKLLVFRNLLPQLGS